MRFCLVLIFFLVLTVPAYAAVEVALRGQQSVVIEDVYRQRGVSYIAVEDLLKVVGLTGHWDSVAHTYRIRTSRGWAVISPATRYLRIGDSFYPLQDKPIFIDGRLRVSEGFVQSQLSQLTGRPVFYRDLNPGTEAVAVAQDETLDQLFGRLLSRSQQPQGAGIRAIAIDPGHGGLDTGVIAVSGYNEKILTFEVAERLARLIRMRLGIPVYLSRSGDYEVSLEQRLASASREDVDLWILLHAQNSFSGNVQGIDLFVRTEEDQYAQTQGAEGANYSLLMAQKLSRALAAGQFDVRGIYSSSHLSLGRGNLPTVQIELGYLSHPEQLRLLRQTEYQDRLAQALFDGIQQYATVIGRQ